MPASAVDALVDILGTALDGIPHSVEQEPAKDNLSVQLVSVPALLGDGTDLELDLVVVHGSTFEMRVATTRPITLVPG